MSRRFSVTLTEPKRFRKPALQSNVQMTPGQYNSFMKWHRLWVQKGWNRGWFAGFITSTVVYIIWVVAFG